MSNLSEQIDQGCCNYFKKRDSLVKLAAEQEQEIIRLEEQVKSLTKLEQTSSNKENKLDCNENNKFILFAVGLSSFFLGINFLFWEMSKVWEVS
jgi:hypothetical protein